MKPISSRAPRQSALDKYSRVVHSLGGYPFFGTALGIIRNGGVLPEDDDVDFILPVAEREELIRILTHDNQVEFRFVTEWIIQASFLESTEETLLDFYFFWEEGSDVRLPWNFFGTPWRPETHLLVPVAILGDLYFSTSGGFWAARDTLARYLYGNRWTEPMAKGIDYEIRLLSNRPKCFYPGVIGRFARKKAIGLAKRRTLLNDAIRRTLMLILNPSDFLWQIRFYKVNQREECSMLENSKAEVIRLSRGQA